MSHGLVPGDKVENQVSVPKWIESNPPFVVRCLKGLTDTDGFIYVNKGDKTIMVGFNNASLPLVQDFKRMCSSIGVDTSDIKRDKRHINNFTIIIPKRDRVKKFLEIVKPELWNCRKHYLGTILISLTNPEISAKIEAEVKEFWRKKGKKVSTFTKEFEAFLKNICVKYGLIVDETSVNNAIDEAFRFREIPYRKEWATQWKIYYEQLGSFRAVRRFLELYHGISPRWETIQDHIKVYMRENKENYKAWFENVKKNNPRQIVVRESNGKPIVTQFPSDLRIIVLRRILNALKQHDSEIPDSEIVNEIKNMKDDAELVRMLYLLGDPHYQQAITNYVSALARLARNFIKLSNSGRNLSAGSLLHDPYLNLPWSEYIMRQILKEIEVATRGICSKK